MSRTFIYARVSTSEQTTDNQVREVEAAGFALTAESIMLANKSDSHSIKVFDASIKGDTDRFAYRFERP